MGIKERNIQHAIIFELINGQRALRTETTDTNIVIQKRLLKAIILILSQNKVADIENPDNFDALLDVLVTPENAKVFADKYELQATALNNPEFVNHIKDTFDKIIQAFNTHFLVQNDINLVVSSLSTATRIMELNSFSLKLKYSPESALENNVYTGFIADFYNEVLQILKEAGVNAPIHLLVNLSQNGLSITMGTHNDTNILILAEHSDTREEWQKIANYYKRLHNIMHNTNMLFV